MGAPASHRLALLIPTRNRRQELKRLLDSLRKQTRPADYLLLIDGGEEHVDDYVGLYPELPLHYLPVYPPGLTKQRNAGLAHLPSGFTLIGFLDDDLELLPNALENMLRFWETAAADVVGASFNILNNEAHQDNAITRFFGVSSPQGGCVLPSGFNTILFPVERDTQTQWLSGGATVWRADLFKDHQFEQLYPGYGHFDDLDFSFSLGKARRLMVLKEAQVYHYSPPIKPGRMRAFGLMDTIFRYRFVKKYHLSTSAYVWATLGQNAGNLVKGLVRADRSRLDKAWGVWQGLFRILRGQTQVTDALDMK